MSFIETVWARVSGPIGVLLLFFCLSNPSQADTYGDFTYTYDGSAVTITDCSTGVVGAVTIPSSIPGVGTVTTLGFYAFYNCKGMTSVTIPSTVTTIVGEAFSDCKGLTSVTIPSSVTNIGNGAFLLCTSLTNVTIPSSITRIPNSLFAECSSLTTVTIPSSVTSIGGWAFVGCWSLTSAYFQGNAPYGFDSSVFSKTAPNFVIYYPATATGYETPYWYTFQTQPIMTGSLQVSIVPAFVASAGAQWQVDGGEWRDSGSTLSGLVVGSHTVEFKSVAGWSTPSNQTITITENQTTRATGTYAVAQSCTPHAATAVAQVVNGFVVGGTITDPGCGYTNAPEIQIIGTGSGAAAVATAENGIITEITIRNPGSGYSTNTVLRLASPFFPPALEIAATGAKVKLTLHVMLDKVYVIEGSPDLKTWTDLGQPFTAHEEVMVQEFDIEQLGRYFRIRQVSP